MALDKQASNKFRGAEMERLNLLIKLHGIEFYNCFMLIIWNFNGDAVSNSDKPCGLGNNY